MAEEVPSWTDRGIKLGGEKASADKEIPLYPELFDATSAMGDLEKYHWVEQNTTEPVRPPRNPYAPENPLGGQSPRRIYGESDLSDDDLSSVREYLGENPDKQGLYKKPFSISDEVLYATVESDPWNHHIEVAYGDLPDQRSIRSVKEITPEKEFKSLKPHTDNKISTITASNLNDNVRHPQPLKYRILDYTGLAEKIGDDLLEELGIKKNWEYELHSELKEEPYGFRDNPSLGEAAQMLEQGEVVDQATAYSRRVPFN